MKKVKSLKENNTSNKKIGMGSFTGSGVKNPIGRVKEGMGMNAISKNKLKKPPKSLA
jgi:hypothetical protein